jgi:uncharacterized membrane protein YfcA
MKPNQNTNRRKVAFIFIGLLLTVIIYQVLWKSNASPLKNNESVTVPNHQLADGIWGSIGFYKNPADNIITYIFIGVIVLSIIYNFYSHHVNKPNSKRKH